MDRLPSMSTREVSRPEVMQGVARKQQPDRGQCHLPEFLQDFNARFGEDPGNTVNLQSRSLSKTIWLAFLSARDPAPLQNLTLKTRQNL